MHFNTTDKPAHAQREAVTTTAATTAVKRVGHRTASVVGSDWWTSENGGYRWYDQLGLPYTETPHIVFRDWFINLPLVEIRIVSVVLELTVGWHRERTKPLPLSVLCCITKHSKPIVHEAVSRLRDYGILDARRLSRRQPYCYSLIFKRHLNELREAPAPAKQPALPLNVRDLSVQENLTTQPPEVKKTLPLSGKENLTTQPPVLICIKETNTHKETRVCGSKYSREFREQYAAQHNLGVGWLRKSEKGERDADIDVQIRRDAATKTSRGETIHERLRREGAI